MRFSLQPAGYDLPGFFYPLGVSRRNLVGRNAKSMGKEADLQVS
ncbi:Uncharacterised protein [Serratia grimesii]|nr:Uncharacterised protein [Serratia grimesii]CAI1498460.1 Uncharacterised protein [Serratia grimesii]